MQQFTTIVQIAMHTVWLHTSTAEMIFFNWSVLKLAMQFKQHGTLFVCGGVHTMRSMASGTQLRHGHTYVCKRHLMYDVTFFS